MKYFSRKHLFVLLLALSFAGTALYAMGKLTPEMAFAQAKLEDAIAETGYADAEVDELHKKISLLLPQVTQAIEQDAQGNKIRLHLRSGRSMKTTGENYIVNGYADLYVGDSTPLERVVLTYERTNTVGNLFRVEKREMINPTPNYNGGLDSNEDITIVYYEMTDPDLGFQRISETTFREIALHEIKTTTLRTYKQYLRVALNALELKITDKAHEEAAKTLEMIEFE